MSDVASKLVEGCYVVLRNGLKLGPLQKFEGWNYFPWYVEVGNQLWAWTATGVYASSGNPSPYDVVDVDNPTKEKQTGLSLEGQKTLFVTAHRLSHIASRAVMMLPLDTIGVDEAAEDIRSAWELLDRLEQQLKGEGNES